MSFNLVLGQDQPKKIIQKSIQKGNLSHAYLFFGPESVGKKLTAIQLAKTLNCTESQQEDSCDQCPSCRKIDQGIHPDVFLLEPVRATPSSREAAINIERVRNLQKKLSFLPYEGKVKVAIIDSVEKMNPQAANSFLKTLEEPPSSTVLLLTTSNRYMLLPTMVSRCQGLKFLPLKAEEVRKILVGKIDSGEIEMDFDELELRCMRAMGRVDQALDEDLLEVSGQRQELLEMIDKVSFARMDLIFNWCRKQARQTHQVQATLDEMQGLLRDLALLKTDRSNLSIFNKDLAPRLKELATEKSISTLATMFDSVRQTKAALSANANVQLSLENMLVRFCEAA